MDTILGKAELKAQAKITRADGTVEIVDVTEQMLKENPGLVERLINQLKMKGN